MIKKFSDFRTSDLKNTEVEFLDRELDYRKKMRTEMFYDDDSFDDIKSSIVGEIEDGVNYHITIGNKVDNLDIKDNNIEYQSSEIGRFELFEPDDNSQVGEFSINGRMYEVDADEIRIFYHFLKQQIKNK